MYNDLRWMRPAGLEAEGGGGAGMMEAEGEGGAGGGVMQADQGGGMTG
uniref:Uncharacterized protein n=1 Tax=Oryza sativa subsp. indica TaxID=39946 RepID=C5NNT1_ORYSI|nr:hypothetical protein [Oryza sativa Indica Group]